ncbi:MAG: DUF433 domain-containing protein [Candidatus Poribacteria bacterium]|nr:DUF433 domain-containing protein [Candidatus Poribacteria bacterium]
MKYDEQTTQAFNNLITCNPRIMSGTPVFKNTRVPIKNLIDYLEAGDSLDEFLEDFPSVSRVQAMQALELAKEMLLTQAYAYSVCPVNGCLVP